MRLATSDALSDAIDAEIAWRRVELAALLKQVKLSDPKVVDTNMRAGIALLYAHWEGWIKSVATLYIEFVVQQRPEYAELSDSLFAASMRSRINASLEDGSPGPHRGFATFIRDGLNQPAVLKPKTIVKTDANLTSGRFRDVVNWLGLDYAPYRLNEKLIDLKLLKRRNTVAHGEHSVMSESEYLIVEKKVVEMLNRFTADIRRHAETQKYLAN